MNWKTLSSQVIVDDEWCTIRKEKCLTPAGKIIEPYYVYDFPAWVAALPITSDGRIVMIKQYRHALGEVVIELPGGCVDKGDKNFEEAIERETREETGYTFSGFDYLGKISPNPSTNSNYLHMFLARDGEKLHDQQLDENEDIEVLLLSMGELKSLLLENKIIQSMHVSCIFYALLKMDELRMTSG